METLLFTDIEGSTRLWEEHPTEMAAALARHDEILAKAVAKSEGRVLKTTGDGMIAVFGTTQAAVTAAIDVQDALLAEDWGPTGPLRVRMGIHVGETQTREGDLFGPTMNRSARIMAAGHGGQVLLSGAAAGLLRAGTQVAGVTLRDLGKHRLKDLTQPEHLYQLVHLSLGADFPPPVTLDRIRHNLPLQATEFLGRQEELTTVRLMLETPTTRLVTIAGPGGAGKTRLGLQLAAEELDNFRDGVFFVDLTAERDPETVVEAIVRALEIPVTGSDPFSVLKTALRDRQVLVVLDNFEQVIPAAPKLSELLQAAPGLKLVVTSRETLRIRAEYVYPIPPLQLPHPEDDTTSIAQAEAVQLFAERARAVRPDFVITDANASAIAEICLRLDGLPLAIELAAARLNVFTPADLFERIRQRLDILSAGGRDLPDRQRTLWGAIGWSYELLDDPERELFELLSVFSTTNLGAIETVATSAGYDEMVLDVLASLVDKSLVRRLEGGSIQRFQMLQTIKEFASERLAAKPEQAAAVGAAHAAFYSAYAGQLYDGLQGSEREGSLANFELEIGNLRGAWAYLLGQGEPEPVFALLEALWSLNEAKGWYRAAIELATAGLDLMGSLPTSPQLQTEELTLRISLARAKMAIRGYDLEVEEAFKQALELSRSVGTAAERHPVLRAMATFYMNTTDFATAAELGRELIDLGQQAGNQSIEMEGHYVFGAATSFTGGMATGLPHLAMVIDSYDPSLHVPNRFRLGPNTAVVARTAYGLTLWQCGRLEEAVANVVDGLRVAKEIDHPYSIAYSLYHNGYLALLRERFDECRERAHQLATIASEQDYPLWSTLATVLDGVALSALGEVELGLHRTEEGVTLYQGLTTPPIFWPLILGLRAFAHTAAGSHQAALDLVDESIRLFGPGAYVQPDLWSLRGDILRSTGDLDAATTAYETGAGGAQFAQLHYLELHARNRLVALNRAQGRTPDGTDALAAVLASLLEGPNEPEMVRARELLGAD